MLDVKLIICILTMIAFWGAYGVYEYNEYKFTRIGNIVAGIAGGLSITFCILLITTNRNLFTIPTILLFISVCVFFGKGAKFSFTFWRLVVITIIAYFVAGEMYLNNVEECEVPDVSITTFNVICATNDTYIGGSMSESILKVEGSATKKFVYKYYYQAEDGGIKLGTIPADSTTIYLVERGENAYLERIVTTEYLLDNNQTPATRRNYNSETMYKLYIPEGSIMNGCVFF